MKFPNPTFVILYSHVLCVVVSTQSTWEYKMTKVGFGNFILFLGVFVVLGQAKTCHTFVCQDPVDPQNLDICTKIVVESDSKTIQYVGSCKSDAYCHLSPLGEDTERCHIIEDIEKYAGQKCSNSAKCHGTCLLYTSPSPRDLSTSRMPSSA
eukprot:TRINITY_DN9662_c0_g1_i12.p1 TRINITY_DN9662_c0_g1~~TRINITY_DN9662_c0_g1_i12.p1  ORF type:complete len:152 (+),score=22.50 TRINITY_DN9662_c0_g1_i12:311-766(+)